MDTSGDLSLRILVGGLGLTAAVLAALQTWYNAPEKAIKHRKIASELGDLGRDIEMALYLSPETIRKKALEWDKAWKNTVKDSPAIPNWMKWLEKRKTKKDFTETK